MRKISTLFFSLIALCTVQFSAYAFELDRVILSTTNNPLYIQFWPVVAPVWQAMGIRPTLVLVAGEDCPIDTTIGDVIRFTPLPDVPEALQAQAIRLLIPALFPDDVCLLCDIDMLPMSPSYFKDWAAPCPENHFLIYRDWVWGDWLRRTSMCYNAAKGSVFGEIFGVSKMDDIPAILRKWHSLGWGWETDELVLYEYVTAWEQKGNPVMRCHHSVGQRLDRGYWKIDFQKVDVGQYIDCHCPRPYLENKETIDLVVQALMTYIQQHK